MSWRPALAPGVREGRQTGRNLLALVRRARSSQSLAPDARGLTRTDGGPTDLVSLAHHTHHDGANHAKAPPKSAPRGSHHRGEPRFWPEAGGYASAMPICLSLPEPSPAAILAVLVVASAASTLLSCASPGEVSGGSSGAHADWHRSRLATLTAEDGWLTLAGLDFLEEGETTFGSGEEARLRYEHASRGVVGAFVRQGDIVEFRAAAGAVVTVDGTPATHARLIADDQGAPTVLRDGPVMVTLVRRNGRLALRVRDNASSVRTGFAGIGLMPYDALYAVEARVLPATPGERVAITNVTGFVEEQPVAARLRFTLGGAEREFVATAGSGGRLFVVFADTSNGDTTYGGGRFLDIPAPLDGRTTIDFNRATNPPCSFTPFATCPLPPAQNRLPIPVPAGERAPGTR